MFADEMDRVLNPILSDRVIAFVNGTEHNGQFVFSTHNMLHLDLKTYMKEQIYFVTKNREQLTSEIHSLSDFPEVRYETTKIYEFYMKGILGGTAIGLQAVDGLKPSQYLIDIAIQNIEGKITMKEAQSLIDSYYEERPVHLSDEDRTEEADKVSSRIAEILSETVVSFSTNEYIAIHRKLFQGIYKYAGKIRDYNIVIRFKEEMARVDSPYCIIFCKVLKRDVQKFEDALEKLKNKMLLLGHNDYVDVCDEIAMLLDGKVKGEKYNEEICFAR